MSPSRLSLPFLPPLACENHYHRAGKRYRHADIFEHRRPSVLKDDADKYHEHGRERHDDGDVDWVAVAQRGDKEKDEEKQPDHTSEHEPRPVAALYTVTSDKQ